MSDLKLNNASIIVVSGGNNPMLLNHDFLQKAGVVSKDYEMEKVFVTPPLSQVVYKNGFSVQMEPQRVTFGIARISELSWQEILPNAANKFLEALPHVAYKAVGLNFGFISEAITGEAAEMELINNFLSKKEWFSFHGGLTGSVIDLQFRNKMPQLNLKIAVNEIVKGSDRSLGGPFLTANYHHDFANEESDARSAFINQVGKYEQELHQLIENMPLFNIGKTQ